MKITSSEPKDYQGVPGKGLIIYLGIKTNVMSKKNKKARYAITNVSMKDIYNIIKDFEKLPYTGYAWKRSKHVSTDSYFYLARQLDKCMMRTNAFNLYVDPVRKQINDIQQIPILHVCDLYERESKEFPADKILSHVCSTDEGESESVIVDESSTEER